MLLFLDESGTDHVNAPYEVLAGIAVRERNLCTAVQIADIVAYSLNWGTRLNRMSQPTRPEMVPFGQQAFDLRYIGQRPDAIRSYVLRPVYGITYIDDLRPRSERAENW